MKRIDFSKYPVPRIRHHANAVLYLPLSQHRGSNFSYPAIPSRLKWSEFFTNGLQPDFIDIGSGLGKFLVEIAVNYPQKNILGVEVRKGAVEWTDNIIKGEDIPNAAVIWYSAVNGFPFIDSCSIEKVFYLFPDPWVKKRHNKRRAFSFSLLEEIYRILKPEGRFYIMTDVEEVDVYHKEVLKLYGKFKKEDEKKWDVDIRTYQEEFCISKGIEYSKLLLVK
ncbi:MAG: hypothetical protein N2510_04225 [Ignavibacteria bacterium]|nr:hypothetical protein [Ignavibacteria bacterium]